MTEPAQLLVARKYLGVEEVAGAGDNPTILGFVTKIAAAFPEQASYAGNYEHDETAWCGLAMADWHAEVGIRGPFGPRDVDKWLFADAWMAWGKPCEPRVGAVVCFGRHVAMVNRLIDADMFEAIGGNQSSPQGGAVTLSRRRWSDVKACRWPAVGADSKISDVRQLVALGATRPAVTELQKLLRIPATGTFDVATDAAVRQFQVSRGLDVDGEVGPLTWDALNAASSSSVLTQKTVDAIVALAGSSDLARYNWDGRGKAPIGYVKGMAVMFGVAYSKLKAGDSSALAMAKFVPASDKDALDLYQAKFNKIGLLLNASDKANLQALFVLLTGLGMRESSGRYCEGRDRSASNTSSDECEAGLFQQSWNSHTATPEIMKLFTAYSNKAGGFEEIFREGVTPHAGDLENFGDGIGAEFQALAKSCPAFAVEAAAVGLRVLRNHWGPIKREEAEVNPLADELFRKVRATVDAQPVEGDVLPPVKIDADLTLVLSYMLQETTMTEDDKALIRQALSSQTLDAATRAHLLQLVAPSPPPPPATNLPALHGFDPSQLLPLIQNPDVQKAIGSLMPILLPAIFALISGHPVSPIQTAPSAPPAAAPPVASTSGATVATSLSAGVAGAAASLMATMGGLMGPLTGPDASLWSQILPFASIAAGAAFPAIKPILGVVTSIFSTYQAGKAAPKVS